MANNSTVDNILDAAETLFAEKGFAETSLRAITSKADVNLAAVNYHFGSKKSLIQAVFARFLDPFSDHLLIQLNKKFTTQEEGPAQLKELLETFAYTIYAMRTERLKTKDQIFVRLIDLAYSQGEGHLLDFLRKQYGEVFTKYLALFKEACPHVPDDELFWRIHFALGAAMFSLSGFEILAAFVPKSKDGTPPTPITIYKYIIPFLIAGINSESVE